MDSRKILCMVLCLWVVLFPFCQARRLVRDLTFVSVNHCQCPFSAPLAIDSDSDSGSVSGSTCEDDVRHVRQSLTHVIGTLSEFFDANRTHVMHVERHLSGLEEPESPADLISTYNHLTDASLHIRVAEELLPWTDHEWSTRVGDPVCAMSALLHRLGLRTGALATCERGVDVPVRSRTRSHVSAMREMRRGLRKLQAVYSRLNSSQICSY